MRFDHVRASEYLRRYIQHGLARGRQLMRAPVHGTMTNEARVARYGRVSIVDQDVHLRVEELRQVADVFGWAVSAEDIDDGVPCGTAASTLPHLPPD